MKIVIAGAGEVGTYLAKMLNRSDHDIILIDEVKEKLLEIASYFDLLTVHGSATSLKTLQEANVGDADLFIAVAREQAVNIISSILAKKLGAKKTIARIDNNEYIDPEHRKIITELGADSLVYPEILASDEIVNIINHPGVLKSIEFASGRLSLFTLKLTSASPLVDKTLIDVAKLFPDVKARVVAVSRGSKTIIPRGHDVLREGDTIYIVADSSNMDKINDMLNLKDFDIKNVMILGGSRIGVKTAKALEKNRYVKLFEKDREKSLLLAEELSNTLVINAEARSAEFLMDEGISRVDAFIAVTGNSEINILSSLLAKRLGVKITIAEVENTDYIDLAKNMEIDFIINKKLIAASHIFAFTVNAEVASVQCFTETDAEVVEFIVSKNAKITRKPLKDIDFPEGAIVGGVDRGGEVFIAVGDTHIQAGDRVVVFALPNVIDKVAKFFK